MLDRCVKSRKSNPVCWIANGILQNATNRALELEDGPGPRISSSNIDLEEGGEGKGAKPIGRLHGLRSQRSGASLCIYRTT